METTRQNKPQTFEVLTDEYGIHYAYNHDIRMGDDGLYHCTTLYFGSEPSQKDCISRLIRLRLTANEEFDIINTYNRSVLGLEEDTEMAKEKYVEYLVLVDGIKKRVREDFAKRQL